MKNIKQEILMRSPGVVDRQVRDINSNRNSSFRNSSQILALVWWQALCPALQAEHKHGASHFVGCFNHPKAAVRAHDAQAAFARRPRQLHFSDFRKPARVRFHRTQFSAQIRAILFRFDRVLPGKSQGRRIGAAMHCPHFKGPTHIVQFEGQLLLNQRASRIFHSAHFPAKAHGKHPKCIAVGEPLSSCDARSKRSLNCACFRLPHFKLLPLRCAPFSEGALYSNCVSVAFR